MEIDYYQVYGVEPPQEEAGEREREDAEPADTQEELTGEREQEAAGPAGDNLEEPGGEPSPPAGDNGTEGQGEGGQSREENARYAAARRKAEQERDAAIAQAREEAKAEYEREMDQVFARSGMVNPYTKTPIRTKAEYDTYMEQHNAELKSNLLKKSGMSNEQFDAFVNSLPQVRESAEKSRQAQQAMEAARQAQAQAKIEEQVQQVHALDPTINSVGDFTKMENYSAFYQKVKEGMNFYDAYRLVNFDKLTAQSAARAKRDAINKQASKAHLTRTQSRGTGEVEVPESVKAEYRTLMPTLTDAEITAAYTAYLTSKKK